MNKQVKRAVCLENVYAISQHTVESSGRYIKSLRHTLGLITSESEKLKYEYKLTRSLQKHIMLLQESIIHSAGKAPNKSIEAPVATKIIGLTRSPIAFTEGKYSYVDVDSLRNMKLLKKAVMLKKDVVLPIKVKSQDEAYKFNVQVVLSKNNVLSYASSTLSNEVVTSKLYRPIKIERFGKGIRHNELIEKAKSTTVSR